MPRLTELEDVLFPVEEHSVFVCVRNETGERRLSVPDKMAIVNTKTNQVLSIVSRGYRLVTNRQALNWAYQCCQTVFPETKPIEWQVKSCDAPATGGHCFIDLAHNSTTLDFQFVSADNRPDAYGPFIRVSNSYNKLRALSFDIGYFRKKCKNGMIVPETIIRFNFTHTKREIGKAINFDVTRDRLSKINASFIEYFGALHECKISRPKFEPLLCGVLKIMKPKNIKTQSTMAVHWEALSQGIAALCDRYAADLGENAYAVFNAMTEFASHPPQNRCVCREGHSFQRLAGDWLSKFSQECRKSDFTISSYLEELSKHNGDRKQTRIYA